MAPPILGLDDHPRASSGEELGRICVTQFDEQACMDISSLYPCRSSQCFWMKAIIVTGRLRRHLRHASYSLHLIDPVKQRDHNLVQLSFVANQLASRNRRMRYP